MTVLEKSTIWTFRLCEECQTWSAIIGPAKEIDLCEKCGNKVTPTVSVDMKPKKTEDD